MGTIKEPRSLKRPRRTDAEMETFRAAVQGIIEEDPPMTVRQVYYQAVVRDLIEKTDKAGKKLYDAVTELRKSGRVPFEFIEDNSRSVDWAMQWNSVGDRIAALGRGHRRNFWQGRDDRPAIWLEKDALVGTVLPITMRYGVPLMPGRGDASLSFYQEASRHINAKTTVYVFTDLDGKGEGSIYKKIGESLAEYFNCHPTIERVALKPAQVKRYKLPTRPPKKGDKRSYAVELDALPKAVLQQLVEDCIRNHVDGAEWDAHLLTEEEDRKKLERIAKRYRQ